MARKRQSRATVTLVRSTRTLKVSRRHPPTPRACAEPTAARIVRALRLSRGADQILRRIPEAATLKAWSKSAQIARFSACGKSGSARWLDLWDCDHFDGFTDMARSIADCRAWFSHKGYTTWGSAQTASGRINCAFNAPAAGHYSCVVQLQSYPSSSAAEVECRIDNSSFGNLPVNGTVLQPHFSYLSKGLHHFRIRQVKGSFFFLSLTVYKL